MNYKDYIAIVEDFPIKGISFKDITPLLKNGEVFKSVTNDIATFAKKVGANVIKEYSLEYGTNTLCMHADALNKGDKVLIVDDLLATGGTIGAAVELINSLGADVVGCAFVVELTELRGREKLGEVEVLSLTEYPY